MISLVGYTVLLHLDAWSGCASIVDMFLRSDRWLGKFKCMYVRWRSVMVISNWFLCIKSCLVWKAIWRDTFLNNSNPISKETLIGTTWVWNPRFIWFGTVSRAVTVPRLLWNAFPKRKVRWDSFRSGDSLICLMYAVGFQLGCFFAQLSKQYPWNKLF